MNVSPALKVNKSWLLREPGGWTGVDWDKISRIGTSNKITINIELIIYISNIKIQ